MARSLFRTAIFSCCVLAFAACSAAAKRACRCRSQTARTILAGGSSGKITHVVYVIQENRSFDDLFQGYPGADTVSSGKTSDGQTIKLRPISLKTQFDTDHSSRGMFEDCRGTGKLPGTQCRMDGFNRERIYGAPPNAQYSYVPHAESKPYFDMAHEFVRCRPDVSVADRRELRRSSVRDRGPGTLERQFAGRIGVGLRRRQDDLR